MKILHCLFVAALLLGTGSLAMASPGPGDQHRGQRSGHNDQRRGDGHDHRTRYERHDRGDHRRYDHRRVITYRNHGRRYDHPRWRRGYRYTGPTYVVRDYGYYRLRQPPRGYRWVRAQNNDYLLVAIATGIILDVAMR